MDIPKLIFQTVDENNEISQVKPDRHHVHHDDYHTYEGSSPMESSFDERFGEYNSFKDDNNGDVNIEKDLDVGLRTDTICSISELNDYSVEPDVRCKDVAEPDHGMFLSFPDFNNTFNDGGAVTLNDPFSPADDEEGLWFSCRSPSPNDEREDEDLSKQCDKILTYEHEFALPIICQPFVEKQERVNRSFGERDFSRHRKNNASHISHKHKFHKHKHSRKDKDGNDSKDSITKKESRGKDDLPKRPHSATFGASAVLALMPLGDIAEQALGTEIKEKNSILKHARSMNLSDGVTPTDKDKENKDGKLKPEKQEKHRHRHHKKHNHARHLKNKGLTAQDTLESRIRSGMHALEEERKALREIVDEMDENIGERDLEDITSHRFGRIHQSRDPFESMSSLRPRRHHRSGMLTHVSDFDTVSVCSARPAKPHMHIDMDTQCDIAPTQLQEGIIPDKEKSGFVELEELTTTESNELQWKERARWIKFEEDVEKNERWGKPHVASLSFQSLLELRRGLETGTVLLNLDNFDLPTIFESVVENMIITDQINSSIREKILAILLSKHCHHHQHKAGLLRRRPSVISVSNSSVDTKDSGYTTMEEQKKNNGITEPSFHDTFLGDSHNRNSTTKQNGAMFNVSDDDDSIERSQAVVKFAPITEEPHGGDPKTESDVKERIPEGAEATSVLVATVEDLERPAMAFVRLAKGCFLGNLTEVSIPVRFLFVIMGPPSNHDYFEIGRSIATLMSDKIFHDLAYSAKKRDDILAAINSFLDDSIVLAPGDWDRHLLLPLLQAEISEKRRERIKLLKEQAEYEDPDEENPLQRTGHAFGGLKREVKKKLKFCKSDFVDGFNVRCLISIIFVFFATFAPTITFGALLEKKTKSELGVMETLLATSICGILFGLFSGQPLMIVGTTGPILVFEEATYELSRAFNIDFLTWRVWIGVWVMLILWTVVALEGCYLVEHFTRFTEEVFSVLISLLFVYEAINFLIKTYKHNPLRKANPIENVAGPSGNITNTLYSNISARPKLHSELNCGNMNPNVALLSTLLLLGTFLIAYYLRKLRVSHFLSSKARRVLSDFGVPFAMCFMVVLNSVTHDIDNVPKLKFQRGLKPTKDTRHSFFINPFKSLDFYWVFVALFPALCVSILLFMETELTGVLLNKRKNKLKKGGGYNMDLFIMGALCGLCSILGFPWMCAATVRSVQHQNALAIMSRSHAPGEKPYLLRIIEQRMTNVSIHVLIGICVAAYTIIEKIPLACCFGVFLYLGISSLSGIQFIEQLKLIFVPSKYHPNRKYIRNVKYSSLVWYTMIQVACLLTLVIVKLTDAAPAFPFVIIGMVFLRRFIERYFTEDELEDLDNEDDGDFDDYDEYGVSLTC